jgi:hypothetical protein
MPSIRSTSRRSSWGDPVEFGNIWLINNVSRTCCGTNRAETTAETSAEIRIMNVKTVIYLASCVVLLPGARAQEIKFSSYIEPIQLEGEEKPAKPTVVKKGQFPLRFGMKSGQVERLVGEPSGKVRQGDRLTYSYPNGYIEFTQNRVAKMKWDGKYYSQQGKPAFARAHAGMLEIKKVQRPKPPKVTKNPGPQQTVAKIRVIKAPTAE